VVDDLATEKTSLCLTKEIINQKTPETKVCSKNELLLVARTRIACQMNLKKNADMLQYKEKSLVNNM